MYFDRELTCRDCGQTFTFTAGEQEFFAMKGFKDPGRCPSCRGAKRGPITRGGGATGVTPGSYQTGPGVYGSDKFGHSKFGPKDNYGPHDMNRPARGPFNSGVRGGRGRGSKFGP